MDPLRHWLYLSEMSQTIFSAAGLAVLLSACSSGQPAETTTGGTTGTNGTTSGSSVPTPVSTLASFNVQGSCVGAPTSVAVDPSGNVFTVSAGSLLQLFPDGGSTSVLPSTGGVVAVTANSPGTVISEGIPIALISQFNYNQKFVTGGATGCADSTSGEDGGVGFVQGTAIAADIQGSVYVADWSASQSGCTRIRKVSFSKVVTTIAGTGVAGYKDGPGSIAQFYQPSGIAVDKNINLYISDSYNNRIRMVAMDGTTTTIAGNGMAGFNDGSGAPNTPGSPTFNLPTGIAVDSSGNLFVADTKNNAIRMIAPNGATTTLAGNGASGDFNGTLGKTGTATFNYPLGVAVDSRGVVYVADQGNCEVRMITPPSSP